jgi:hypothetical protein
MPPRVKKQSVTPNSDMDWIKEKLTEMDVTLNKLHQTVIGDKAYGQKGLVEEVNEHRMYIAQEKNLKAKFVGGSLVVGTLWTLLLKFWGKIFI